MRLLTAMYVCVVTCS